MRRRHREEGVAFKMTGRQMTIARVLVCMNKGEPTAALNYLAHRKKIKWTDVASKAQVETALREWWSGTDDVARQAHLVLDESDGMMHSAILEARRFAVDGILETWVDSQNVEKGINPVPGLVMEHASGLKRRLGLEFSPNRQSCRRWLQRWRRRRKIHLRRESVRERQSVEEMHRKVIRGAAGKWSLGWSGFRFGGARVAKNGDHFPVAKSRPPYFVVIKTGPRNWSPFLASPRREPGFQELLSVSPGQGFVEVE